MKSNVGIMMSAAVSILLLGSLSFSAQAGIEPSPFKPKDIISAIDNIIKRMDSAGMKGASQAVTIQKQLTALKNKVNKTKELDAIGNAVKIMDSLSAVMLNPQPEPQVSTAALNILMRLSAAAIDPKPELKVDQMKALGIMNRISQVAFNPQPEPPGRDAGIAILDKISAVAFNPQPEPPGVFSSLIDVLDRASSVMFNPQPEPPGRDALKAMTEAVGLMGNLLAPKTPKPTLQKPVLQK